MRIASDFAKPEDYLAPLTRRLGSGRQNWRVVLSVLSMVLVINALVGVTFIMNIKDLRIWFFEKGYQAIDPRESSRQFLGRVPAILARLPESLTYRSGAGEVPNLLIDIKFANFEKIKQKRAEALERGMLIQEEGDYVSAKIRYADTVTNVKLRLKGDLTDHFRTRKWSFRIKTKGDSEILGFRRFSVQSPTTRGFQGQKLFDATLHHVGVLTPRRRLVYVTVNGDDFGLMDMEEHFSKELLEGRGRREGILFHFDESLFWDYRFKRYGAKNVEPFGRFLEGLVVYRQRNSPIAAFNSKKVAKSARLSSEYAMAVGLLRGYVGGHLDASEVFDASLMGRFLAVSQLWGAFHGVLWNNLRFYLNPITGRIEPIGFDQNIEDRLPVGRLIEGPFYAQILEDPVIRREYETALRNLHRDLTDGALIEKLRKIQGYEVDILRNEFYFLGTFNFDELLVRAKYLIRIIGETPGGDIPTDGFPLTVHANIIDDTSGSYLEIANAIPHSVRIESIDWIDGNGQIQSRFSPLQRLELPFDLQPLVIEHLPQFQRFHFEPLPNQNQYNLQVTYVLPENGVQSSQIATPYFPPLTKNPVPDSTVTEQLAAHSFLMLDEEKDTLAVRPGSWSVEGFLIVPEGYSLTVPAGTVLAFQPDAALIARGPLNLKGTKDEQVVLRGQGDGDENTKGTWLGVAVLNAPRPSTWSYVSVLDTSGVELGHWAQTGGVTFYQSPVQIENSLFSGHIGEDALNIFRSEFELRDIHIFNTASDAFDSDFSDGLIVGGLFEKIGTKGGGDAIDVSGSHVVIEGARFAGVSDKALSVGENSHVTASNLGIYNVGTGAASKDGSTLIVSDSSIRNVHVAGLLAYVKKQEYGPGYIQAENIVWSDTGKRALAQTGSTVMIDGVAVSSEHLNVDQLYRTVMRSELRQ